MVLPIRMILVASGAVQNETASGEIDGGCLNVGKIIRSKRHYDLTFSTVGFIFSTLHLIVLLYVRFVKKKKGFELLFTQACLSFLSLLFLVIGCLADLCVFEDSKSLIFFRGHIWLFMVNSLIAAYSFLIIVLCIDRHVALTRPLYYRVQFVRYRIRFGMISGAIILAMVCAVKWFFFNEVLENGVRENRNVTGDVFYIILRSLSVIFQYFISGLVMILLSICNILRLRELRRAHANELRMSEKARNQWTRNHQTIARICTFQAVSFVVFNYPYAVVDYFYSDELNQQVWFSTTSLIMNLCQVLFIQLNLFFFAFCSRSYRKILFHIFGIPFLKIRSLLPFCLPRGKVDITSAAAKPKLVHANVSTSTIVSLP